MSKFIKMSDDEWFEKFQPIVNPTGDSGMSIDGVHYMFETYDPDHAKVLAADPACVWTLLDCDNCEVIGDGYHYVNRVGYFITKVPADPACSYEIMYWDERELATEQMEEENQYELRVRALESEGMTRSDAQAVADAEQINIGDQDG
jgi:hypothetical protein